MERGYTGAGAAGRMRGAGDPQNPYKGCPAHAREPALTPAEVPVQAVANSDVHCPKPAAGNSCAGEPFLNFLVVQKQTRSHSRLPLQSRQEGEADRRHGNSQLTATWEGQPPATLFPGPQPSPAAPPGGTRLIFHQYSK